ncbi:hypothetical protein C8R45DRAFT_942532 [Mycena sanguinolenta]|nr:hypothetical protein C8R45DRAFT_942532 [Mycena sanguinolenta]
MISPDPEKIWPEVHPAPPPPLAGEAFVTTRAESTSHVSTWLALPAPNKAIGLVAQMPEIQLVYHGTMDEIKVSLFFTKFLPILTACTGFVRPIMTTIAENDPKMGQMQLSLLFHHPLIKFI